LRIERCITEQAPQWIGVAGKKKPALIHRFGRTIVVRAEVSKRERGCSPFDTSGRTEMHWTVAESMIKAQVI